MLDEVAIQGVVEGVADKDLIIVVLDDLIDAFIMEVEDVPDALILDEVIVMDPYMVEGAEDIINDLIGEEVL